MVLKEQLTEINIWKLSKIASGQKDDYTTGSLLAYRYFKEPYKLFAIDLTLFQLGG